MYDIVIHEKEISTEEYFDTYVNLPMLEVTRGDCQNYNRVWSCPKHDFDVEAFWKSYKSVKIYAVQIIFSPELREEVTTEDEFNTVMEEFVHPEVHNLEMKLREEEAALRGSRVISPGGRCQLCPADCTKPDGKPCRQPERMRQSLEALGGNVVKTAEELLNLPLQWPDMWQLPEYLVFTGGLLIPKLEDIK